MIDRRKFIKTISALGITLPALNSNLLAKTKKSIKSSPVILCSRGEKMGKKSTQTRMGCIAKKWLAS